MRDLRQEALIVSPFTRKGRISQLVGLLSQARTDGAAVTVITRPPEDFRGDDARVAEENIGYLRDCGICVKMQSAIHQKCAVLDGRTVWYGSINLLSFGASQESMMRFQNRELAEELLNEAEKTDKPPTLFY